MKRTPLMMVVSAFALTAGTAACRQAGTDYVVVEAAAGTAIGIDMAAMDTSVKPGDVFYAYAIGGWMKATEIPADRASVTGFPVASGSHSTGTGSGSGPRVSR